MFQCPFQCPSQGPLLASAPQSPLLESAPSVCASQAPPSARTPKCPFQQWDCRSSPTLPKEISWGGVVGRSSHGAPNPLIRHGAPSPRIRHGLPSPRTRHGPELPASPWRSPVSPSWSSLQGAHPAASPVDMLRRRTRLSGGGIMSGFWTLCSLFFPWVSLYGYFSVLVKLIWLFLAPVLVLLNYFPCVYKSWVSLVFVRSTLLLICV